MPEETPVETLPPEPTESPELPEPAEPAEPPEPADAKDTAEGAAGARGSGQRPASDADDAHAAIVPLRRLVELALTHAEIGPPLADLAYAIGYRDVGDQLVRMGTDREKPRLEYFVVAAHAARRARRYSEALELTLKALRALREQGGDVDDGDRVLQLVRTGLSVLMFDLKDLTKEPEFSRGLAELLPTLEDRLGEQPLFRTLLAQALWFTDRDASEREWERARELVDPQSIEMVWNARGTWAKEADRDLDKAERAYRRGLDAAPESALLLHNLAQVLVERAEHAPSPGAARHLLNQAQEMLRRTLRADVPRLRRHIHATRDRLEAVRRTLPRPEGHGDGGDGPPRGYDRPYDRGGGGDRGGGERGGDRTQERRDDRPRYGRPQPQGGSPPAETRGTEPAAPLATPAVTPAVTPAATSAPMPAAGPGGPPPGARRNDRRDERRDDRRDDRRGPPPQRGEARGPDPRNDPGQAFLRTGTVTLGDILKAKLGLAQAPPPVDRSQKAVERGEKGEKDKA